MTHDLTNVLTATPDGVAVRVKVVPGASRTRVGGVLGDRIKVLIAAPAEAGRANRELCGLLADVLGVVRRDVSIVAGERQARKTVRLLGAHPCQVVDRLRRALGS